MAGRVLVTGATGFLGGAVLRRLRQEGVRVIGAGRDARHCAALRAEGFEMLEQDLARPFAPGVAERLCDLRAVVHCAARSSPHGRAQAFEVANVTATRNLLEFCAGIGVSRFVFVSSSSVSFAPIDQLGVRESDPLPPPFNAYARTKRAAERLVLDAPALGPVVLRPRGIYGAGDTALLPRLLRAARRGPLPLLRDGCARIDLTHIGDAVAAVMAALDAGAAAEGQVFNISGGEVLPVPEIAGQACARAGVPLRWRRMPLGPLMAVAGLIERASLLLPGAPEPAVTRYGLALFAYAQSLDLTAAGAGLGWRPQISFEEGLARTFAGGRTG
ncbi:MAG: NAD-dependent epimerase/dehydratase family protein [Pseudorhodobacter sp.]